MHAMQEIETRKRRMKERKKISSFVCLETCDFDVIINILVRKSVYIPKWMCIFVWFLRISFVPIEDYTFFFVPHSFWIMEKGHRKKDSNTAGSILCMRRWNTGAYENLESWRKKNVWINESKSLFSTKDKRARLRWEKTILRRNRWLLIRNDEDKDKGEYWKRDL